MIDYNLALTICAGVLMASFIKYLTALAMSKLMPNRGYPESGSSRSDRGMAFSRSAGEPFHFDAHKQPLTHQAIIGKTKDGMSF